MSAQRVPDRDTKRYPALAYRQATNADAPLMVTFVAEAEDLITWASVPRREHKDGTVSRGGFQRGLNKKRVQKVQEFFSFEDNQSPTAIILGVPRAASTPSVTIEGWQVGGDSIQSVVLVVDAPSEGLPIEDVVQVLRDRLTQRVEADTNPNDEDEEDFEDEEEEDPEASQDQESKGEEGGLSAGLDDTVQASDELLDDGDHEGSESDAEEQLQFGKSELKQMLERLEDMEWVRSVEDDLRDLAKPALIIDGQHRLYGAKKHERGIPFAVCALIDVPWSEEVFQFTVVNHRSTRLSDQFIAGNAAISLTTQELAGLVSRLEQADIPVEEFVLMDALQWQPESPFHGLIGVGERPDAEKLGYKTMVRMAREWREGKPTALAQMIRVLYPDLGSQKLRLKEWKEGDWQVYFWAFWAVVKERYESVPSHEQGHTLWSIGHSNLMIAVVLQKFQSQFLAYFAVRLGDPKEGEVPEPYYLDALRESARKFCDMFKDLLIVEWKEKSLNTASGKQVLDDAFSKRWLANGNTKVGSTRLVKGPAN